MLTMDVNAPNSTMALDRKASDAWSTSDTSQPFNQIERQSNKNEAIKKPACSNEDEMSKNT